MSRSATPVLGIVVVTPQTGKPAAGPAPTSPAEPEPSERPEPKAAPGASGKPARPAPSAKRPNVSAGR